MLFVCDGAGVKYPSEKELQSFASFKSDNSPFRTRSIKIDYLENSSRQSATTGTDMWPYREGRWGRVEVRFITWAEYLDEIKVEYRILMSDRKTVLVGTQTCIHVKKGSTHYTSIYVHPNVLEQFGGTIAGASVRLEDFAWAIKGYREPPWAQAIKGHRSSPSNWWARGCNLVEGKLANWHFTPFDLRGIEKYEVLKLGVGPGRKKQM